MKDDTGMGPIRGVRGNPHVSVIMATYNGAKFICHSIGSILAQTWTDFELIIVDDCSTDDTVQIVERFRDPRIRLIRNAGNIGVVRSRNRCFAEVRGVYVAMLDHDDLSRPTRLQKQVRYLDDHPSTVVVGTAAHNLVNGKLEPTKHPQRSTPMLIRWLLHVANPLVCSSVMFRAETARVLGCFMREDYKYADDYDFYHRMMALGDIARLDEPLTIYRHHAANTFRSHEETMTTNAVKVLAHAYRPWFESQAEEAASLVVRHLSAGHPILPAGKIETLHRYFERLNEAFLEAFGMDDADRAAIRTTAAELWQHSLRATARLGGPHSGQVQRLSPDLTFSVRDYAHIALTRMPLQGMVRKLAKDARPHPIAPPALPPVQRFGSVYEPVEVDVERPPTLFVVVDTEAEFDWAKPFARNLTAVSAMDDIERGQAVFDEYGVRPVYVVDFPIASQARSAGPLRGILERGACHIGAHLHPWTTPPFEEQVSSQNSFPGNLPPDIEEQKLKVLVAKIEESFGVAPRFYKAGRYGFGDATAAMLARHGIRVDLSVLPGADLRRSGGPDFRKFQAVPYRIADAGILSMPMTRGHIGMAAPFGWMTEVLGQVSSLRWLRLRSVLSRFRIVDTITLTPEGVTASEQIRLIEVMLERGHRIFVLHYHSPTLSKGHTPYARTDEEVAEIIGRLRKVCRHFFEELGGMPGDPAELLRAADDDRDMAAEPMLHAS